MDHNLLRVRVTGLLVEEGTLLLVKQRVSAERGWSLPGGKVERGESLDSALRRELYEETGLETEITKLLYLCDLPENDPSLVHITFLVKRKSGDIRKPTNEYETTPIHDVKMVPIDELASYGFSERFVHLLRNEFPGAGSYMGHKRNIGL